MIRLPRYDSPDGESRTSDTFDTFEFEDEAQQDYLPAYDTHPDPPMIQLPQQTPLMTRLHD
jgi:hypothetical protein